MKKLLLLFVILLNVAFTFSQSNDAQKAEKYLSTKGELTFTFKVNSKNEIDNYTKDFSIVNFDSKTKTVKAWANKNQFRAFQAKNIPFQVPKSENEVDAGLIYDNSSKSSKNLSTKGLASTLTFPVANYPTYAQYAQQMQDFENDYPTLVDKFSIGTTTQGDKELLFVKISDNVGIDEQEPKLLFTSSMHGDEIAGYPMMLSLIDYILTVYSNPGHADHARVKNLVENAEIWINPNANPDGTYHNSSSNTSVVNARRGNANNIDLNRNYPDNVAGPHDDGNAYQTETLAFMALADANHFVISANFHGGTELVNYPFDNAYVSQYTHPDGNWFEFTGVEYATHTQNDSDALGDTTYMTVDEDSNVYPSPGVTHGAEWYRVYGGRQDFMNFYHQCREITVELSDTKILPESQLVNYWLYNRDALLDYLTQGTYGFRGTIKDANTNSPIDATVTIVGHDAYGSHTVTDVSHGDYYRPIKGGTYDILFEAPCYQSETLTGQTISDYQTLTLADVLLTPIGAVAPMGLNAFNLGATTASLDWDATSGATYDLRYREVGNSTWTNVNGLSSASTNLTGLTALTQYEAQVRSNCNGGSSSPYSTSVNFTTTNVQLNYCNSASTNVNDEYIGRVQLNTIDNSSGAQFYTDFTSISTTLTKDTQFTITVTPTWTGTVYNEGYSVWIDYNIDGDFDDAGEQVWTNARTKTTPVSGNFTIPSGAVKGSTRMRVSMKYNAVPTSCETFQYGEVEDYTVTIQGLVDTTAPVITLNGASTINLNVGDVYTEQGATASDNKDGDITASIVTAGDTVDTNTAGIYVVTYNVSDAGGNPAAEVTRTVNVIPDTTAPVITLNGASTINLNVGDVYTEQGATASDNKDGDITASIVTAGDTVDTNTVDTYVVTYNVSDAGGNPAAEVTRTVNVTEVPNGCTGGISSFPYVEGFENTLGAWTQSTADDINWTVDANGTPSNNTGPSSATQGSYYVFVEASSPNYPSKRAILNSPCFDLSGLNEATFSFKYHMYGSSDMGTIDLEISTDEGSTWTSIWNESGNKGNSWQTANVDVSAYTGGGVQLRFNRFVGGTWQADIAIDDVSMVEGGIVVTACSGGITTFPYTEGFENTLGAWTQSTSDDINWIVDANGTPSNNTGPASAVQGSYYIFVEASGNSGYPNKQAIINSPCYDLSGQTSAIFNFSYHMYGSSDMGTIALEASNDNGVSWTSIWNESGNKGNSWQTANVDLSSYVSNSVQLRFNRVTGGTWQADVAIDNINLTVSSVFAKNNLKDKLLDVDTNSVNTFMLYPNPVKGDVLNIKLSKGTNMSYKIINMLGQVVNTGKTTKTVKVNNLEAGMYYIEVNDGNKTMTKKFIKRN